MTPFHFSLPDELAEYVRAQIASGHYASDAAFFTAILQNNLIMATDWLPSDASMRAQIAQADAPINECYSDAEIEASLNAAFESRTQPIGSH